MRWSQLAYDMVGSALPAILDRPPAELYAEAEPCDREREALREARAVTAALGLAPVALPGPAARSSIGAICALPPALARPLLRKEVARRGPRIARLQSEVPYLHGAVCRAGAKLGVPTPASGAIYQQFRNAAQEQVARGSCLERTAPYVHRTLSPAPA
jgi:ketopantoate reductase